ncbi:hypothetical protein AAVH_01404 [Aphelenchoides avenae]|nr:hypothetical protein AAVH_01404 [Aphelenchus avenae]
MDLFGQIRQGIAKAAQIASDSRIFHEIPECSILAGTDKISIKLKDQNMHHALKTSWHPETASESVFFLIRNEENRKQTVMVAEVQSGYGVSVKTAAGKAVMVVRPPDNDPTSLGKIMHPAPATIYKVMPEGLSGNVVGRYLLVKSPAIGFGEPIMRVEKVMVSMYPIGKAVGLFESDSVYWFKRLDGTILGYVRPKIVLKSNTLVVKFM